jgi:type IV pilus assembly protein PilE
MKRQHQRGVTLMELLTVVAVLGIIAAIAVPSYRSYLVRAQRSEAKTLLLQVQTAQERFYLQANRYTDNLTDAMPAGLGLSPLSPNGCYSLLVDAGADQTYTARAIPTAACGQDKDKDCTEFQINESGRRSVSGDGAVDNRCWR